MNNKNVFIIAGPNGSGKTTFANKFLPDYAHCQNFANADLIAQGLSPFKPNLLAIKAGKLVLNQIRSFSETNVDFGFETTLSGKLYVSKLKILRKKGYKIHIFFLWIPNANIAIARIKERVLRGGHFIPAQDVKRRFNRSIHNFFALYQNLADSWILFNNSDSPPVIIAKSNNGHTIINDVNALEKIKKNSDIS